MDIRKKCEFFLIRYVPDPIRGEFTNIGVLLREAGTAQGELPLLRFTHEWGRARCLDPDVDIPMLEALEQELRSRLLEQHQPDTKRILEVIEDSFSNSLQITTGKSCLAESMIAQFDSLMRVYVEPKKRQAANRQRGRAAIQAAMQTEFDQAGVWDLMQKRVPASRYTSPGDQLRIDCGYRPNGVVRMFHAVSLESDAAMAKVLAFSLPTLREGVARREGASLQFTAVVEPLEKLRLGGRDENAAAQYRFAIEVMQAVDIRVMVTSDLLQAAQIARQELHVA